MSENLKATNDGTKGGLLKGKRHYDKDGKPLGGIKAIVSDTGQMVELEGGEVIINREASKKHWRELSKINQSAGNGVPILPPDTVEGDTEEYRNGGNTVEFNPNKTPTKWIHDYALKLKENYPKVWNLTKTEIPDEAFKNLSNVYKRGYWLDGEEWFYYKWRVFNQKYKDATSLVGVLTSLKWCNINKKGWRYMKQTIEKGIKEYYPEKFMSGGKFPLITEKSKKNLVPTFIDERLPKNKGVGSSIRYAENKTFLTVEDLNKILKNVDLPFKVTEELGMGLYGNAYATDRDSVLKVTFSGHEAYSSFMIMKGDYESQVKVFNVFKITDAKDLSFYFIEKELVQVAEKILEGLTYPFSDYYRQLYRKNTNLIQDRWEGTDISKIGDEDLEDFSEQIFNNFFRGKNFKGQLEEKKEAVEKLKQRKNQESNIAVLQTEIDSINEFLEKQKSIIEETYRYLLFVKQMIIDEQEIDISDFHTGNFGKVGDKYVCFDCSMEDMKSFFGGGNVEQEPPANFENVLWEELSNMYLKGGGVVTWKHKYNKKYGYDKEESHDLKEISKDTGISLKGLQQIYNKGVGAYNTNPQSVRPNVNSEEQWAMGRVYSAVMGGKASKIDANELKMMAGGELKKGIKAEQEHADTIKKIYEHKVPLNKAPELIAKDHIEENPKYYTELAKMEKKFAGGGNIGNGDRVTFYERGSSTPTEAQVISTRDLSDGRTAVKIKILSTGKRLEVYKDRLTKVDSTASTPQPTDTDTRPDNSKYVKGRWYICNNDTVLMRFNRVIESSNYNNLYYTDYIWNGSYKKDGRIANNDWDRTFTQATRTEILKVFNRYFELNDLYKNGDIITNNNIGFKRVKMPISGTGRTIGYYRVGEVAIFTLGTDGKDYCIYNSEYPDRFAIIEGQTSTQPQPQTDDFDETEPAPETFFNYSEDSKLNFIQQTLVRTKQFKAWFGDWETAKNTLAQLGQNSDFQDFLRIYKGVSKAVNSQTKEPLVVYHGTKASDEFFVFEANRNDKGRPYAYFAVERSYALNFTRISQRNVTDGKRFLYQCFLDVKNPFNGRISETNISARLKKADYWKQWIADRLYKHHKIGISSNRMRDVVISQIGSYIDNVCQTHGNREKEIPFWYLMAKDTESKFKYFLISHKFDSIMYNEESTLNMTEDDYNNPEKFTRAFAVFDSYQIKLADGRNIDFEKLNPDIRYEDGGSVGEQPIAENKKQEIGRLLRGDTKLENGGNLEHSKGEQTNRQFVENLISKMK